MGLGDELVELAVGACHRCETPLHLLRRNLVEKMADSDRVSELFGRFALQGVVGPDLVVGLRPVLYGLPGTATVFRSKIKGLNQQGAS